MQSYDAHSLKSENALWMLVFPQKIAQSVSPKFAQPMNDR